MLNLSYILTILVFNQSLCFLINAQQDLDRKPTVLINPTSLLPSTIYQPDIIGNNNLRILYNYPDQQESYSSNNNYNNLNQQAIPVFNSYYESIVPIASQPIQNNLPVSNTYNWNDITEERSAPIKPPVELHHGYRYTTPAISFSNIEHLKNVIYNELGLDRNPNDLPSLPQGFLLQQAQAEIPNKENFVTQKPNGKTKILTHQTNLMDHRKNQNITILTPVDNLTFTYHYAKPNVFDHRQLTHENKETPFSNATSSRYNSTFEIKTSPDEQIFQNFKTENKTPETSFHSDTLLNQKIDKNIPENSSHFTKNDFLQDDDKRITNLLNVSNVLSSQQELTLNIRPSIQLFENIQPGNVLLQTSSESTLKLGDIAQTEFNNNFSEATKNKFLQYDHFMKPYENDFLSKRQMTENLPQKSNPFIPTTTSFLDINYMKPNVELSHNIKEFIKKTGNNPLPSPERQNHFVTSQKQYMPIQSLPHDILVSKEQSLDKISPKPSNQQYTFESGILSNIKNNDLHFKPSGNSFSEQKIFPKPTNPYTFLDKNPSEKNQQYTIKEPGVSSTVKDNDLNFQQFGKPFVQYQQNKVANIISNIGPNLQNQIYEHKTLPFPPESKNQNQIIFPTNFELIGSSNFETGIPTYPNFKAQDTVGSNIQKGNSEHSERISTLNIQGNSNSHEITNSKDMNQIHTISDLQPNKYIHKNMTHTNQLTNNNSFIAVQRPILAFYNEYINPRTSNYQTQSSNDTPNNARKVEFAFNTTNDNNRAQQKNQYKTPIVFPKLANNKLRSPHLVYGSPI